MTTLININEVTVKTTATRRYGNSFFSYGHVSYKGKTIDCGDPYPSGKFPFIEGLLTLLMKTEGEKQVSEREFRQCFKGMKNGAEQYSKIASFLEDKHNVNFI